MRHLQRKSEEPKAQGDKEHAPELHERCSSFQGRTGFDAKACLLQKLQDSFVVLRYGRRPSVGIFEALLLRLTKAVWLQEGPSRGREQIDCENFYVPVQGSPQQGG